MNERLQYEQLIGEKLQSLPVPDMQDAIWARVKAQLDIDLPTDDNDGGSSPQSPSGPGNIGWGLSVVIIALLTTFFVLKNKAKTKTDNTTSPATEQIVSPSIQNNSPPLPGDNTVKKINTSGKAVTNSAPSEVTNDSVAQQDLGVMNKLADDSTGKTSSLPLVIAPPKSDTVLPVKKGKGLKLKDEDYRIVPKNNN